MRKLIFSLTALSALASAAPAMAQVYGQEDYRGGYNDRGGFDVDRRIDQLGERIERGIQRGVFDRREAYRLRTAHIQLSRLEDRYARNGLSRWERDDLNTRIQNLRERIRYAAQHGNATGRGWDDDDRWDRNDDNRYDRDDRWNDDDDD